MEFQGRGAGHIHGVTWCDLKEISELLQEERKVGVVLPKEDERASEKVESKEAVNHLESAYRSLRENKPLTEAEENSLIHFVDRSVTCTLNPDLAAKMMNVKNKLGQAQVKLDDIVKVVVDVEVIGEVKVEV